MSMSDPLIGQRLGDYLIEGLLGTGGMARVYRGYDENLDRYAAVKVIEPQLIASADEEEYRERFLREARAIARLSHPRIVSVYQFNQVANLYYIAMEYVEGPNLRDVLKSHLQDDKLMPTDAMMTILADIADALDYAHKNDIIHRDVKPSNIIVTNEGNAVLTDFGLALNAVEGTVGNTFGSVHYIAPEQAISSAQAVPQSDQYSLGIVAYEIITGRVPFDDDSAMSVALKHISDPPPPPTDLNPNVPAEVEQVILKSLDKEVHGRYDTARNFVKSLQMAFDMIDDENIAPPPEIPAAKSKSGEPTSHMPPTDTDHEDKSPTVKDSQPSSKAKRDHVKKKMSSMEGKTESQPLPDSQRKKGKTESAGGWGRWVAAAVVVGLLLLVGGFVVYDNYSQSVSATTTAVAQIATDSAVATDLAETAVMRQTEAVQTQQSLTQTAEINAAATETEQANLDATDTTEANADATETEQANLDATNTAEADVSSTPTLSPTPEATATPSLAPTVTETPIPTNTPPPAASPTPMLFVDDPTAAGAAQVILRYDGRLLVLGNRSDSETYNLSDVRFLLFAPDDNGEVRRAASYAIGDSDTLQSAARNFNPQRCLQMLDNTQFSGLPSNNNFADELCAGTPFWATTGSVFWAHPNTDDAYFEVRLGAVDVLATCPVNVPNSRSELRCAVNLAP